MSKCNIKSSS